MNNNDDMMMLSFGIIIGVVFTVILFTSLTTSANVLCKNQFNGEFIDGKCYKQVVREEIKLEE